MNFLKSPFFFLFLALLIAGVIILWRVFRPVNPPRAFGAEAIVNGHTLSLEIARTMMEQAKGLAYRDSLAEDSGMLFPYPNKNVPTFWMVGMRFPLDMIWIDGTTVTGIQEQIPPETHPTNPTLYPAPGPSDKVLEVNAGTVQRLNIQVGSQIQFRGLDVVE